MIITIINIVSYTIQVFSLFVLVYSLLSFFMSPFHPVREALDRIMNPILLPIRNALPQTGMMDFSPLILLLLLYVIRIVVVSILLSIA